jgi:hypothetical protein
MLASATLIRPEVISSSAEVEIHEEKVFAHLDEEKERDVGTWVLDTGATPHVRVPGGVHEDRHSGARYCVFR